MVAEAGGEFILDDVRDVLNDIEQSTMGADSADDFNGLFDRARPNIKMLVKRQMLVIIS
ncbi:hypothetical protein O9993_04850 [Vibrio lentus]|nr:hypothetical protein [Vibrio lentus]